MLEMTQYELQDLFVSWVAQTQQMSITYLSIVSGYLLVAHFLGSQLSRPQVIIVNAIYIVYAIAQIGGFYSQMGTLAYLGEASSRLGGYADIAAWGILWCSIQLTMLIGSLYFMWTVRHPKNA